MRTVRSHPTRWWLPWRNRKSLVVIDQQGQPLIGGDPTVLTHLEVADAHNTAVACRAIEHHHNTRATAGVRQIAARADDIMRESTLAARRDEKHRQVADKRQRIETELAEDGLHLRGQRRMGKVARWVAIVGLGVLDITAYRSAMSIVFNTSDANTLGVLESYLLAMLSIGMVIAAAFCGASIRHYLDAKSHTEHNLKGAVSVKTARREALVMGVPAGLIAIGSMVAGATMRIVGMQAAQTTPIDSGMATAVTFISGLALFGAFLIEMKWASEMLDKYDRLRHEERGARRRLENSERRLQLLHRRYRIDMERLLNAWATFQPTWDAQIDACTERIHRGRGLQPAVFTVTGHSVRSTVEGLVTQGDTRLDTAALVVERKLTFDDVVGNVAVADESSETDPIKDGVALDDEFEAEPDLRVPDDARELDDVLDVAVDGEGQ